MGSPQQNIRKHSQRMALARNKTTHVGGGSNNQQFQLPTINSHANLGGNSGGMTIDGQGGPSLRQHLGSSNRRSQVVHNVDNSYGKNLDNYGHNNLKKLRVKNNGGGSISHVSNRYNRMHTQGSTLDKLPPGSSMTMNQMDN
jgi:hypothetical protein